MPTGDQALPRRSRQGENHAAQWQGLKRPAVPPGHMMATAHVATGQGTPPTFPPPTPTSHLGSEPLLRVGDPSSAPGLLAVTAAQTLPQDLLWLSDVRLSNRKTGTGRAVQQPHQLQHLEPHLDPRDGNSCRANGSPAILGSS